MKRVKNSKSIICSKKELEMLDPFIDGYWIHIYELPLFTQNPKDLHYVGVQNIKTDYVLIRPKHCKLSERFMNNINKTWNKMYEGWY